MERLGWCHNIREGWKYCIYLNFVVPLGSNNLKINKFVGQQRFPYFALPDDVDHHFALLGLPGNR